MAINWPPNQIIRPGYPICSFTSRNGIYYAGQAPEPSIILSAAGANAYEVRDYAGTVVSTGAVTGTTCTPAPPASGWLPGWYRIYFTGADNDPTCGCSYGATNFVVIRADSRFPDNPPVGTNGGSEQGAGYNQPLRAIIPGLGPQRYGITVLPFVGTPLDELQANLAIDSEFYAKPANADPVRPKPVFCSFPNGAVDRYDFPRDAGGNPGWSFSVCDLSVNGATTFVEITTGTVATAVNVIVHSPSIGTVVETYPDVTNATVNATMKTSNYVRGFTFRAGNPLPCSPKAIGRVKTDGVTAFVALMYPKIQWFEGPQNEPDMGSLDGETAAHHMKLFHQAVKAGDAAAKTLGPNPVTASSAFMTQFLVAGGGAYLDGISVHAYNMSNGDLNRTVATWSKFEALLTEHGLQNLPRWQTEQGVMQCVYGVYHPHRTRWQLLQTIIQEQYGIPREHNNVWYDTSHGFWDFPVWTENGDTSLQPHAPMLRVLSEETYGKAFELRLAFPPPGNKLFIGSSYLSPSDGTRTIVLIAGSVMDHSNVTLKLAGAIPASVVACDSFGNLTTLAVIGQDVTVPVGETPCYLRLSAEVTATVTTFNDWPSPASMPGFGSNLTGPTGYVSVATSSTGGMAMAAKAIDGLLPLNDYTGPVTEFRDPGSLPATWQIHWTGAAPHFDRVLIIAGPPWQGYSTLLDFDVQTSTDGTTWTTQVSVDKSALAVSFSHPSGSTNTGCSQETYWPEQFVFDLKMPTVVTAAHLRLNVRKCSNGGEPDAAAMAAGGQGDTPHLVLQEVSVYSDDSLIPRYATIAQLPG